MDLQQVDAPQATGDDAQRDVEKSGTALLSNNRFHKTLKQKDNSYLLSWKDLSYSVKVSDPTAKRKFPPVKTEKVILNKVSGFIRPGQFLAIMGPSGSGKTSLINLLADRVDTGTISGDILINGHPVKKRWMRNLSGYVMQDDVLMSYLTVTETLAFTANLRLPKSATKEFKEQKTEDIIQELGLSKAKSTIIGNEMVRGVSGGERKRCNIANELIANPTILFLDEPTSGLDSFTAQTIVDTLDTLARYNYSVVCTIHQPRHSIFERFDMLMILTAGEVAYFGPAKDCVAYFSSLNFVCPKYYNPPDFFMDMVTKDFRTPERLEESSQRIKTILDAYKRTDMLELSRTPAIENKGTPTNQRYNKPIYEQFVALFARTARNSYRNKSMTIARLMQAVVFSLLIGLLYLNLSKSQKSVQNRLGVIFIMIINTMFGGMFSIWTSLPPERNVFWKEHSSGMYSSIAYYLSKNIVELPICLVPTIITSTIVYWMTGLNEEAGKYFLFLVTLLLVGVNAEGFGYLSTALFPKVQLRSVVSMVLLLLLILFGGFYLNPSNTPVYFIWVPYISFIRYAFESLMVNEFKGATFNCPTNGDPCPFPDGSAVLDYYDLTSNEWVIVRNIFIMLGMAIFLRTMALLPMAKINPKGETQ